MGDFERTVREFKRTLTGGRQKTAPLDIMGKVTRVEDGVAWVRFAGSEVGDTPVRMNIDCKVGDVVQVRSSGGKAWIVGNQSAPPTDDSKAEEVEKKTEKFAERIKSVEMVAGDAEEVANAVNQKVWSDEAGLHIADGKQDAAAERNTIWNSLGMLFRKGLNPILGILTGDNPRVAIYDGQGSGEEHEVASFGSVARIGSNSEYAAVVGAGRFGIESGDNVSLFDISPSGNPTSDTYTVSKSIPPNTKTYTLEHTPINGTSIQCNYAYDARSGSGVPIAIGKILFTAGSFGTKSKTERGTTVTITYSSPQTFTMSVSYSLGNEGFRFFSYKILGESVDLGILTFGTRRDGSTFGNNSATIGNDLLASHNYQTVVGKSNKDYNGPFVVGNGDAGSYSSAFAVDWEGNVKAKGDMYIESGSDLGGGTKLISYNVTTYQGWRCKFFTDGTCEAIYSGNPGPYTCGTARGNLYTGAYISYLYPTSFVNTPSVVVDAQLTTESYVVWAQASSISNLGVDVRIVSSASIAQNSNYMISIHAFGRWF